MTPHAAAVASTPDPAWGFGLGGVILAISIPMLWAGLHIRGRTYNRLKTPVDLAYEGLAERTLEVLRILRQEIDSILPTGSFDPYSVIADPAKVAAPARKSIRIMTERHRLLRRFRTLLRICSVLKYVGIAFTAMTAISMSTYFFYNTNMNLWQTCCWLTAATALGGGGLIAAYGVLETKIQSAIEHAGEGAMTNDAL